MSDVIFHLPATPSERADELYVEVAGAHLSIAVCAAHESRASAFKLNSLEVAALRDVLSKWLVGHGW